MTPSPTWAGEIYWKQMRDQLFAKGVDGWWLDAPEPEINGMGFPHLHHARGAGLRSLQRLSADALDGHLSRAARHHRRQTRRHPHPLGLRRPAAQQRHYLVGRHPGNLAGLQESDSRGTELLPLRHPLLEHRYRRLFRQSLPPATAIPPTRSTRKSSRAGSSSAPSAPCSACMALMACSRARKSSGSTTRPRASCGTYLDLRYRLLPYLYSVAWQVTSNGSTFMRPLVMDFRKDPQGAEHRRPVSLWPGDPGDAGHHRRSDDALGLSAGRQRSLVQLLDRRNFPRRPARRSRGPRLKPCRCSSAPARSFRWGRSCSIPVRNPPTRLNCAFIAALTDRSRFMRTKATITITKKGNMPRFRFHGTKAKRTLEIGKRTGGFPGMLKERTFNIVWVSKNHGAGVSIAEKPDAVVHYNGGAVKISSPQ